ncbi:hypothetical protein EB001_15795 [bacterium]|nr:hypothetical protein [bacterium]
MSIVSNLYADKAFSEHPIALWSLDDSADYVSLIPNQNRNIYDWATEGCESENFTDVLDEPFINSSVTKIKGNLTSEEFGSFSCISPNLLDFSELSVSLGTFSVGLYVYSTSPYITSYELGYEYYDVALGDYIKKTRIFNTSITEKWIFLSETFKVPNDKGQMRLVFKANFLGGYSDPEENSVLVNGITFGQWSEEFASTSLGIEPIELPSGIFTETTYGYPARSYGLQENDGYYIVNNNALLSKNSGAPMVYGTSNCTIIYPNDGKPSLVLPSMGFLNNSGKYKVYTVEMWLRINSDAITPKKIFGNIEDENGLYVDGPFIILKIGNKSASHYIGEWVRPMLLHILYLEDSYKLYINGEEVLSIYQKAEDVNFESLKEWLGFWAYDDVSPLEIDCVGIYPYKVSNIVAKRRFVYGQGVEAPDNINTAYSGKSLLIDYAFADYSNNYIYPDIGKWSQGINDNLSINNNILSSPEYPLPTILINHQGTNSEDYYSDWINANSELPTELDDEYFRVKPNENYSAQVYFENLNFLNQQVKTIYGVFKRTGDTRFINGIEQPMTLFKIIDPNQNYLHIYLDYNSSKVRYVVKFGDQNIKEIHEESILISKGERFYAGFNIENAVNWFGAELASILGNISQCKLYIGNDEFFASWFDGNIYKVGLANARNSSLIAPAFGSNGLPADYFSIDDYISAITVDAGLYNQEFWNYLVDGGTSGLMLFDKILDHTASYTLVASRYLDEYALDIDVVGYWEDYQPLTYYAQFVQDYEGDSTYDLDFLQFNIDYPSPSKFYEVETQENEWSYAELYNKYNYPRKRTYDSLDNFLFTGYRDYEDLQFNTTRTYKYDTTNAKIRSYISFQYIEAGANYSSGFFTKIEPPAKEGTVEPGSDWISTKYETIDNMIIYPPSNVDFNDLAVVTHLEFKVENTLRNKVKLKKLEYCSQAFNESSNPIGTSPYSKMYPYKKSGIYYSYKGKNPYSIYKKTSPYLYMTRNSGIQLRGKQDPLINRGLFIPINEDQLTQFDKIMAMQVALRFDEDYFPYAPTQIFEIEAKNSYVRFYIVANDQTGQRGRIYGVNALTGKIENGIAFYLNGKIVKDPTLTIKQWAFLGISFSNLLDISGIMGSIKLNGPMLFNNISYYQSTNLQEVQKVSTRPWFQVKRSGPLTLDWDYWLPEFFLWNGVLVQSSISYYGVDPEDIYKSYVGTNKIVVESDKVFSIGDCEYNTYQNVLWQQTTLSAV